MMTKDLLIIVAVVALVAIMVLAALPEITSAMPDVYYVEPTEPEAATEAEPETVLQSTASVRYALTAAERNEIERVVMAEAGAEPYIGQMAVAQCILNACEQEDKRPLEIVRSFGYTAARPEPSDEVKKAVAKVLTTARPLRIAKYFIFMRRRSVRVYGTSRRHMSAPSADTDFLRRRQNEQKHLHRRAGDVDIL